MDLPRTPSWACVVQAEPHRVRTQLPSHSEAAPTRMMHRNSLRICVDAITTIGEGLEQVALEAAQIMRECNPHAARLYLSASVGRTFTRHPGRVLWAMVSCSGKAGLLQLNLSSSPTCTRAGWRQQGSTELIMMSQPDGAVPATSAGA